VEHRPGFALAYYHRGESHHVRGDHEQAVADFTALIRLNPALPAAHSNCGLARAAAGRFDEAIADFSEAIRMDPQYLHAYHGRGLAYAARTDYDQAVIDHIEAIRLCPRAAEAYNNFARFWACCPDPERRDGKVAVELAERACELSDWADWNCLSTLAAAYAQRGDRDRAAEWAEKALALAPENEKEACRAQLEVYRFAD